MFKLRIVLGASALAFLISVMAGNHAGAVSTCQDAKGNAVALVNGGGGCANFKDCVTLGCDANQTAAPFNNWTVKISYGTCPGGSGSCLYCPANLLCGSGYSYTTLATCQGGNTNLAYLTCQAWVTNNNCN